MSQELYDLVFSGQIVRGVEAAQAKRNLQQLFKVSDAQVETLFSGNPVVLKKGLDFDTATKYRVAIKKAGCLVDLREQPQQKAAPAPRAQGRAVFGEREPASPAEPPHPAPAAEAQTPAPAPVAPAPKVSAAASSGGFSYQSEIQAPDLSLAPAGDDLLQESERERPDPKQVDTSGLSLRAGGGTLVDSEEIERPQPRQVNVQEYDLAAAGSDLLKPEEREAVPVRDVDVSALSLAEPGGRLSEEKDDIPLPLPDISGLSLDDNK